MMRSNEILYSPSGSNKLLAKRSFPLPPIERVWAETPLINMHLSFHIRDLTNFISLNFNSLRCEYPSNVTSQGTFIRFFDLYTNSFSYYLTRSWCGVFPHSVRLINLAVEIISKFEMRTTTIGCAYNIKINIINRNFFIKVFRNSNDLISCPCKKRQT